MSGDKVEVELDGRVFTPADVMQDLKSPEPATKTLAARAGALLQNRDRSSPVLVEAGIIPLLVESLGNKDCKNLQLEAVRCLSEISVNHPICVAEGGAIPMLIPLLAVDRSQCSEAVRVLAAWTLASIVNGGAVYRDAVLSAGGLWAMLHHMQPDTPRDLLRATVAAYNNMCDANEPYVKLSDVFPALAFIAHLLLHSQDEKVLSSACNALSKMIFNSIEHKKAVMAVPELPGRLVRLLDQPLPTNKSPPLMALGNMLAGTDSQRERCLNAGCLDPIIACLSSDVDDVSRQAARAAANILKGTSQHIQRALDQGILEPLVHLLGHKEYKHQEHAARGVSNLVCRDSRAQLSALLTDGCLRPYCALLVHDNSRIVKHVLDGLAGLLRTAAAEGKVEEVCLQLELVGAVDHMDTLQHHEDMEVYRKNRHLIVQYFGVEEDTDGVAHAVV